MGESTQGVKGVALGPLAPKCPLSSLPQAGALPLWRPPPSDPHALLGTQLALRQEAGSVTPGGGGAQSPEPRYPAPGLTFAETGAAPKDRLVFLVVELKDSGNELGKLPLLPGLREGRSPAPGEPGRARDTEPSRGEGTEGAGPPVHGMGLRGGKTHRAHVCMDLKQQGGREAHAARRHS